MADPTPPEATVPTPKPPPVAIGTIVEFYPDPDTHPSLFSPYKPPFAALVCGANEDGTVNLAAFNPNAVAAAAPSVMFGEPAATKDGDPPAKPVSYCVAQNGLTHHRSDGQFT